MTSGIPAETTTSQRVSRHLHFAWSLLVHGIAMATGDSSLRRISTVTDLLSFISVSRATQPRLIDGISALPQQRWWGRESPNDRFSTPPNPRITWARWHARTDACTRYPHLPPHTPLGSSVPAYVCVHKLNTHCTHAYTQNKQVHMHRVYVLTAHIHTLTEQVCDKQTQHCSGGTDDPLSLLLLLLLLVWWTQVIVLQQ